MLRPNYYECHVTLKPEHNTEQVKDWASAHGFKTSVIIGDELKGDIKYLYCTTHDKAFEKIKERMDTFIKDLDVPIVRKKIEHIVYDEDFRSLYK